MRDVSIPSVNPTKYASVVGYPSLLGNYWRVRAKEKDAILVRPDTVKEIYR